ncbi:c-type cytochrome [Candidatus Nitrospira bockiana]
MNTRSFTWGSTLGAVAGIGLVAAMGWAGSKESPDTGFRYKDGAEVYAKVCAYCHETKIGPALLGRGLDPLYTSFIVRNGNGAMPAFRQSEIDDQALNELAVYVSKQAVDK